ncbi:MAG: hypothetical protein Q8P81_03195 [Nanoarchaeota archaeon]|nr:hypothetical protein [Nanoarchaeota archaeon]
MKTSFDDVVRELTDMIYELEEHVFKDFNGQSNLRYINKKNRIDMLRKIRDHYIGLSNLQNLLREGKMVEIDPEIAGITDKTFLFLEEKGEENV